ncbi:hypothetical protein HY404_00640 [Candidatus Microgenomates bacterium]|nr:hypothetical protein [Candidatus Microgenomates bacterium]
MYRQERIVDTWVTFRERSGELRTIPAFLPQELCVRLVRARGLRNLPGAKITIITAYEFPDDAEMVDMWMLITPRKQ